MTPVFINRLTDEQTVVNLYNGKHHSAIKINEQLTHTQLRCITKTFLLRKKQPDTKGHLVCDSIYRKYPNRQTGSVWGSRKEDSLQRSMWNFLG